MKTHYTDVRIESDALPPGMSGKALFRCRVLCTMMRPFRGVGPADEVVIDYVLWVGIDRDPLVVRWMAERAMSEVCARGHKARSESRPPAMTIDQWRAEAIQSERSPTVSA